MENLYAFNHDLFFLKIGQVIGVEESNLLIFHFLNYTSTISEDLFHVD